MKNRTSWHSRRTFYRGTNAAFRPRWRLPAALALGAIAAAASATEEASTLRVMPRVDVIGERENLERVPGSAELIEQEALEVSRVFTTNEALRKVSGVNVRDEEGIGLRPNIGIRGLNPTRSTKVLLLEDGIPLAYAPYGDNASYYHPPIERFARIEVLKGAGQVLFGPQTLGGVVNYITPNPRREFGGYVALAGGNRGYVNGHVQLGATNMLLDLMHKESDGARDNEHSRLNDLNYKTVIDMGARQALTLRANYYREDSLVSYTGITQAEFENFGARYNPFKNDAFEADRWGGSATHEVELAGGAVLTTNFYGAIFKRDWWRQSSTTTDTQCGTAFRDARLAGSAVDPDACNATQGRLRQYYTWGVEPRLRLRHDSLGAPSELEAGVRVHYETQDRKQLNGTSAGARTGTIVEDNERKTDAYAAFVQNRFLVGKWSIAPALRVEHIRSQRTNRLNATTGEVDLTEWIPGLGVTFNPDERTTYFAGVHRGFAPPRTEDLIGTTGTFTNVDAEQSWNYELGVRTRALAGTSAQLALFRNDFRNQIAVGSIAGGTTPLAQGRTLYEGLELSARIDGDRLLETTGNPFLQLAYAWLPTAETRSAFVEVASGQVVTGSAPGKRLPYAPEHMLTAAVGYEHPSGWNAQLEMVYVDEQFSDFANTRVPTADGQRGLIADYTIWNAAFNYSVKPLRTTFFVAGKNLADKTYVVDRTRGLRFGMPRLVQVGLKHEF